MSVSEERIRLMVRLGHYFTENPLEWQAVKEMANRQNAWFTEAYIDHALKQITREFLEEEQLRSWLDFYKPLLAEHSGDAPLVGLVMAGNIPLVGFHDFLCVYLSGCRLRIKLSSKDTVLWTHILNLLGSWSEDFVKYIGTADVLKGCDAYIATGSNNSARYFEYYFQKYPHIIRRNRTSVAVLDGLESEAELAALADDVGIYFGLGCRNVTQLYVPEGYNFEKLLPAFNAYEQHLDHNKYKNNYDFQLAIFLLNKVSYMSNGSLLLVPSETPFAAISVLHYAFYKDKPALLDQLAADDRIQCITTKGTSEVSSSMIRPFGANQQPGLFDYADGIDTMAFLLSLKKE